MGFLLSLSFDFEDNKDNIFLKIHAFPYKTQNAVLAILYPSFAKL